ncbi:MAG: aminoacyl-tRNA hydrolase [Synergistaceae bacterium]|nr:aminoacyl-tRNA hydrolase [Synergistaceae bacterium]
MAGLGNPGPEYVWSRHNAGWLAIDSFTERKRLGEPRMKFSGAFWPASPIEGENVAFLKPFTYMNLSGKSVAEAARYYDIAPSDVLIIFDDAAIPFGSLRYRPSGSAGGHKGMISVIALLGTLDIPRLRLGIGAPPSHIQMKDWALGKLPKDQRDAWPDVETSAWEALSKWLGGASADGFTLKIAGTRV